MAARVPDLSIKINACLMGQLEQMIVGMQYIYHERGHSPAASGPSSPVHHVQPGSMVMTSAQEVRLLDLFEEYGMQKGHLDLIADKFEEGWSRARIAKGLKNIGLKRGVLTHGQVSDCYQKLAAQHIPIPCTNGRPLVLMSNPEVLACRKSSCSSYTRSTGSKRATNS